LLRFGLEVHIGGTAAKFVTQRPGDLLRELVVQAVDQVADVILDVADVQVLAAPVAGVEDVHDVGQDLDDDLTARQGTVAEVAGGYAAKRFGGRRKEARPAKAGAGIRIRRPPDDSRTGETSEWANGRGKTPRTSRRGRNRHNTVRATGPDWGYCTGGANLRSR